MVTQEEREIKRVLDELGELLKEIHLESTPPRIARRIYDQVAKITGEEAPFREVKRRSTEEALALYPAMKRMVRHSGDRLLTAVRLAAIGNVIDFGANLSFDLRQEIDDVLARKFYFFDFAEFKTYLEKTDDVLYIGDNAGESVFDKILIEEIDKPVIYVVRGGPLINDVT
jgi:uncharacterized protein with ATP-grasp and redox domains